MVSVSCFNSDKEYERNYFFRNKNILGILKKNGGGYGNILKYDNIKYYKWKINIIKKYEKNGGVLDIGCSFGYFLKYLGDNFDRWGCDVSSFAISNARNIRNIKFTIADISKKIPFKKKFDFITSFDSLEHIENIDGVIFNMKKIVKRNGRLYILVPVESSFQKFLYKLFGISTLHNDNSHKQFLDSKQWENKLKNYFEVIEHIPVTFENLRFKHLQLWSFFILRNPD